MMVILSKVNMKEMGNTFKICNYYIGQWLNGLSHGKGTIYYKNGKIIYDGDFVKGKSEGNCIIF